MARRKTKITTEKVIGTIGAASAAATLLWPLRNQWQKFPPTDFKNAVYVTVDGLKNIQTNDMIKATGSLALGAAGVAASRAIKRMF